jgi:choline monooxygenase
MSNTKTTPSGYRLTSAEIDAVSRPTLEAETLPPECYWDPELYERELQTIFFKEWICVGRVDDVPEPGDYLTTNIATEPVVVVRDADGKVRAYLNVCRHRGCSLVEGTGKAKAFRCPYHGWMYGLNGELRGTPDFKETKNFSKSDYPLFTVKVEIWEGFILISLDADATPFADRVSETPRFGLDKYEMSRMRTTHRWEYQLDCNWKTYVENYIEEYHIPWVHPETFQLLTPMKSWAEYPEITDQPWAIMIGQNPGLSFSDSGDAMFPVAPGLADLPVEYDGMPIWLAYPTMMVIPTVDALIYYVAFPEGPEKCRVILRLCVPEESAKAYAEGHPETTKAVEEYARNAEGFLSEDNNICQQQQIGLRSRHGGPGRFSKHEGLAREFDQWVAERAYAPAASDATQAAGG